jgi:hypothetical protein
MVSDWYRLSLRRRAAPHCSILLLAPFDDQGYPFSLIVLSANRMKVGSGGGSRAQEMSRTLSLVIK